MDQQGWGAAVGKEPAAGLHGYFPSGGLTHPPGTGRRRREALPDPVTTNNMGTPALHFGCSMSVYRHPFGVRKHRTGILGRSSWKDKARELEAIEWPLCDRHVSQHDSPGPQNDPRREGLPTWDRQGAAQID